MNLERLEMMRVMMERVVAGSWEPDQSIKAEIHRPANLPLQVERVALHDWRQRTGNMNACGFNACAVGHACFDPEFRKLGWAWNISAPSFDGSGGWYAVDKFFGTPRGISHRLFMASKYNNADRQPYEKLPAKHREAKMVADRVAFLIENGEEAFQQKFGY
jgi:hypothetical protein